MKHRLFPGVTMVMLLTACNFAKTRDPGELQKSRSPWVSQKGNQRFYKKEFSLEALPHHRPEQKASGVIQEYANRDARDGHLVVAGEDMLADLSKDPYSIAYSGIPYQTPQTKVLALAKERQWTVCPSHPRHSARSHVPPESRRLRLFEP
jgi:hypothetical protein